MISKEATLLTECYYLYIQSNIRAAATLFCSYKSMVSTSLKRSYSCD